MANKIVTEVKVLNIAQPNAHNVIFNGKNVENRTTPSSFRGTIAIYASKTYQKDRFGSQKVKKEECSFGCIIGFADITDCITEDSVTEETKGWFKGPYGYVLVNVVALKKPVEVSPPQGAVIWWTLSGAELDSCLAQVDAGKFKDLETVASVSGPPKLKTSSRARLLPTAGLAEIIGSDATTYKNAATKVIDYLIENELVVEGAKITEPDAKIERAFGTPEINVVDLKALILKHLS